MTAVTANQVVARRDGVRGKYPVAASIHIYEGTLCYIDASGYLTNVINSGANDVAGIAVAEYDNSSGSDGDIDAEVWTEGDFLVTGSSLTQANVGDKLYGVDNFTVSLTATNQSYVGRMVEYVSTTQCYLSLKAHIDPADYDVGGVADDTDLEFGDGIDAVMRFSTGDASNHALVLGLDNTSQQFHITDKAAVATDWARSAGTHPEVAIHSNTTPATDYLAVGNHDGTTAHIDVVGGTTLSLDVAGDAKALLTANNLTLGDTSDTTGNSLTLCDGGADKPGYLVMYSGEATGVPYYLWVDSTGDLRIHTAAPTDEDADGTVVGAQS